VSGAPSEQSGTVSSKSIGIALLGAGVVGSQVVRLLTDHADDLAARVGAPLNLVGVAVRRPHRHPDIPPDLLTTDAQALVADPAVDIVVEVIGGIEPARGLLLSALRRGARVVTANKALLAEDGPTLYGAADAAGTDLYFEAAVAGAIPLIRPIRESLAGDRISRIMGIVNGTTNYILSAMTSTGESYEYALAEATRLGYAEADPTSDVDGFDAAAKAAILASIGFDTRVGAGDVHREGIADVSSADIAAAAQIRCVVKLLAICERVGTSDGQAVSVRVHPVMLPSSHPLAGVDGAYNAVYVEAQAAGRLMFYGPGAGGAPTASAVMGDVVAAARNLVAGGRGPRESAFAGLPLQPMGQVPTRYHICLDVLDRPGVLATVAGAFAEDGVSISTVRQEGRGDDATLVLVTHTATDSALARTVSRLGDLPAVRKVTSVMRVAEEY
jgi:homoserine dehydrogenase